MPRHALPRHYAEEVGRRLEAAEERVSLDLSSWARLCAIVLPELFADAGQPAEACPHLPRTEGRATALAGRAARGEQLHHPDDRVDGLREALRPTAQASNNAPCPTRVGDALVFPTEVVIGAEGVLVAAEGGA